MKLLLALALLCAAPALAAPRADNAWLTQAEAAARAARVAQVDYAHAIDLTGKARFSVTSTISFDLKDTAEALTIDLDQAAITALSVNGKVRAPRYNNWFITLAAADLAPGRNSVTVSYTRAYNSNGEGLHRLVDAADGKTYLFSQLAPANAHQVFALFDQPDLKASYTLTAVAPADWHVISAAREQRIDDLGATRRWHFPATKKMSAYAFSLHAGPYRVWEDNSGPYPLRLFARQSVAAKVRPDDWFRHTRTGFAYFDAYFGMPYQFGKYDQLLVPGHLYGAMENIAAVTLSESRYLDAQPEALSRVIKHEMAHQWFGDLVTMEWWNGLWLSESFASLMASMAQGDGTEFTDPWKAFFIGDKQRGYALDQGPGSHAVDAPIASSANAYDNLDAITYIKGAAALKQLRHALGDDAFRAGVRAYLARHQFGNARLEDFIGELGRAAGRDLGPWTREWLYTAGVSTIAPEYSCRRGRIARFALRQEGEAGQRVRVASFGPGLVLQKDVVVDYQGALTQVPALVGAPCPLLVYPNYQDWGYVKVRLDRRSMAAVGQPGAADPLLRAMLFASLWDAVLDGRHKLHDFMRAASVAAGREQDPAVLADLLKKMEEGAAYMTPRQLAPFKHGAWQAMQKNDTDLKKNWLKLYQNFAIDPAGLAQLAAMLNDAALSQDQRWHLVATLNRHGHAASEALIAAELARDPSASGQAAALRATVLRPDPAIKAAWLAKIDDPATSEPFARIRIAMANLFPPGQGQLGEASADARLARLAQLEQSATPTYLRAYLASMIPAGCNAASVRRLEAALHIQRAPATTRALKERLAQDRRCVSLTTP